MYRALGLPWCPPELREEPFAGEPPRLVGLDDIRGDLHCHTTWSDGRFSVEEMGRAARERGYDYVAICDHTPAVGAVRGLTPDDVRRQGEEIAAANESLAPFRILRGDRVRHPPRRAAGSSRSPSWLSSTGSRPASTAASGCRRREMTRRVEAALRNPYVRCLSHPKGRYINRRPENALDLERVFELALETGVAHGGQRPSRSPRPERRACARGAVSRASSSSAQPTLTRYAASETWPCRWPRRVGAGRRRPTSSTHDRWRSSCGAER